MAKKPNRPLVDTTTEQLIEVDSAPETLRIDVPVQPPLFAPDDPPISVQITLPLSALLALIDPLHPAANPNGAAYYDLLDAAGLSPMGELVLANADTTMLNHYLHGYWRIAR